METDANAGICLHDCRVLGIAREPQLRCAGVNIARGIAQASRVAEGGFDPSCSLSGA